MKIEKINENQIKCTLSHEDLEQRNIKLSEFAYGTPKAHTLFREMLRWASYKFGFEAEDIPLVIEAVPLSSDGIILIVTKIPYPDELDTRFSNFAPSVQKDAAPAQEPPSPLNQLLKSLRGREQASDSSSASEALSRRRAFMMTSRLYSFESMTDAIRAARMLASAYTGSSSLYRDEKSGTIYLLLKMRDMEEVAAMQRVIASLSEYGTPEKVSPARQQYLVTHCSVLCAENALGTLAQL